jgi:putative ABC transport system permease protein
MVATMIRLALLAIRRNPLRSSLTVLGIVIGVAAVITMVTIGAGATAKVTADLSRLGTNLLMIRMGQGFGPGGSRADAPPFKEDDVKAIVREISGVAAVAPTASKPVQAIAGAANWATNVTGTTAAFLPVRAYTLDAGRDFTESEERAGNAVCLIGATVRRELFGPAPTTEVVGERLRLGKLSCRVIGLLTPKGESTFGQDQDDLVLVPLRWFQRRMSGTVDIQAIFVTASADVSTAKVQLDLERLLRERRRSADGTDDFSIRDMQEIASAVTGTTRVMTALLAAVAAVSLLVGGIGIMNIMLVSVSERSREIGIRLAIGALEREVLTQFLIEAVVLSSVGGVVGIVLGLAAAIAGTRALGVPFVLQPGIVVLAFSFSAAVGVLFGFFPARQAARLDPIEALRHE